MCSLFFFSYWLKCFFYLNLFTITFWIMITFLIFYIYTKNKKNQSLRILDPPMTPRASWLAVITNLPVNWLDFILLHSQKLSVEIQSKAAKHTQNSVQWKKMFQNLIYIFYKYWWTVICSLLLSFNESFL